MLKGMFTRAEMTRLSGLKHQTTYRLEEKNTLTPNNSEYNYNQVIFGRILEQVRRSLGVTAINFADNFGPRAQYEIDWVKTEFIFVTNQGAGIIPSDPSLDLSAVINEWLLPLEKEVFVISGRDPRVKAFLLDHFRFVPKEDTDLTVVLVARVRKAIDQLADKQSITRKIEKTKNTHHDHVLVG